MSPDVGALDREFVLQRPTGLDSDSYEDVETVWGAQRYASGNELLRFSTPLATGTYVITIRTPERLRASWRIVEVDISPQRTLQVSAFGEVDDAYTEVFCVEVLR